MICRISILRKTIDSKRSRVESIIIEDKEIGNDIILNIQDIDHKWFS